MNVKTYRARTMQEALALVREELGAQASVLQTRQLRPRGLSRLWEGGGQVEVVASRTVSVPSRLLSEHPIVLPRAVPASHAGIDLSTHAPVEMPRSLAQVEASVPRREGALPLVVVAGGRPGVGITTVALNLSMALARQGRRVVLVDADLKRGGRLPGLVQRDGGSIRDVLAGHRSVHEVLARGPAGIQILPGSPGAEASVSAATWLVRQLEPLVPHCDAVVVDAGSGRSEFTRRLWQLASALWLTVTTADEAILKGYAAIKSCAAGWSGLRAQTFVNRADARQAGEVHARMAEACRRFLGLPLAFGGSAATDHTAADYASTTHASEHIGGLGPAGRLAFDLAAEGLWAQLELSRSTIGQNSAKTSGR